MNFDHFWAPPFFKMSGFYPTRNLKPDIFKITDMNTSGAKEKLGTNSRCDCCTVVSCHPPPWCPSPGLLVFPGLPVFFVLCQRCCSESEDSVNNSRIQHSNCLWCLFDLFSLSTWVHLKTCCIAICPLTVCVCTPCQRASSINKIDSFLWGHGLDTLACKTGPSSDRCGTSLSVSLSLDIETIVHLPLHVIMKKQTLQSISFKILRKQASPRRSSVLPSHTNLTTARCCTRSCDLDWLSLSTSGTLRHVHARSKLCPISTLPPLRLPTSAILQMRDHDTTPLFFFNFCHLIHPFLKLILPRTLRNSARPSWKRTSKICSQKHDDSSLWNPPLDLECLFHELRHWCILDGRVLHSLRVHLHHLGHLLQNLRRKHMHDGSRRTLVFSRNWSTDAPASLHLKHWQHQKRYVRWCVPIGTKFASSVSFR